MSEDTIFDYKAKELGADASGSEPRWISEPSRTYQIVKRIFDFIFALTLLLVCSPLLPVIILAIKLDSAGPVFFRQQRLGLRGKPFTMWKFRTMQSVIDSHLRETYIKRLMEASNPGPPQGPRFALNNDPRITRVGRVLRRYSLDELPQLINVLAGDMSVVGPRPALDYEVDRYKDSEVLRLSCKPGLTGLWQIRGRSRLAFDDMVSLDLEYARDPSTWLDIKIVLQTPLAVLRDGDSY